MKTVTVNLIEIKDTKIVELSKKEYIVIHNGESKVCRTYAEAAKVANHYNGHYGSKTRFGYMHVCARDLEKLGGVETTDICHYYNADLESAKEDRVAFKIDVPTKRFGKVFRSGALISQTYYTELMGVI